MTRGDLTLSWDILDFGLSYVRAQQTADEVLIAEENKRAVINRITEDVRTAYWRAVSAQRLRDRALRLQERTAQALADARRAASRGRVAPLPQLTYRRDLLDILNTIHEIDIEFSTAKAQLAALMNIAPDEDFELVIPASAPMAPTIKTDRAELIYVALRNRPELREISYRQRINILEEDAALLQVFPNLRGFVGLNFDTNDLLFNTTWVGWGARATWNLLNVINYPDRMEAVEVEGELLNTRALALTMAVATQVRVSMARYENTRELFDSRAEYAQVQRDINRQIAAATRAGRTSRQTQLREELNTIVSEILYDRAYADLQSSFANVYASTGLDPFAPDLSGDEPVADLAASLRALWSSRGDQTAGL